MQAETDRHLPLARGAADIDVYATDGSTQPASLYLCECKHWSNAVPQNVVHGFRTVVADAGANFGLLISSMGFQSGAKTAAVNSNIKLLTWDDFQALFAERWKSTHLVPMLRQEAEPLFDYTDTFVGSRLGKAADKLDKHQVQHFLQLREKHSPLGFFTLSLTLPGNYVSRPLPSLPLRQHQLGAKEALPSDILDASLLRIFLERMLYQIRLAIKEFDDLFGQRVV